MDFRQQGALFKGFERKFIKDKRAYSSIMKKNFQVNRGLILNFLIRAALIFFLVEVMLLPHDPRFEGKAIPARNLIVVGSLSMAFPVWWLLNKGRKEYSFLADNTYLSIFLVDMAGNSLNLYDSIKYFDIIAHFHGTGAFAAVCFMMLSEFPAKKAFLIALIAATAIHGALEVQEYLTDVFFGTHNVKGIGDTAHDLIAGVFGTIAYVFAFRKFRSYGKFLA